MVHQIDKQRDICENSIMVSYMTVIKMKSSTLVVREIFYKKKRSK